jgi:hypothetical protein
MDAFSGARGAAGEGIADFVAAAYRPSREISANMLSVTVCGKVPADRVPIACVFRIEVTCRKAASLASIHGERTRRHDAKIAVVSTSRLRAACSLALRAGPIYERHEDLRKDFSSMLNQEKSG